MHTGTGQSKNSVSFRSYKNLDEQDFNKTLSDAPFNVGMIFDDIDDNYWFYEKLFSEKLQEHAPVKQKRPRTTTIYEFKLSKIVLQNKTSSQQIHEEQI